MCMDDNADAKRILQQAGENNQVVPASRGSAPSNRIWNKTTLRSPKQQIWLRTVLCGGWCQRMALRNLRVACQNRWRRLLTHTPEANLQGGSIFRGISVHHFREHGVAPNPHIMYCTYFTKEVDQLTERWSGSYCTKELNVSLWFVFLIAQFQTFF